MELIIENTELKRGPGIWRINNSLLNNTQFCEKMTDCIEKAKIKVNNSDLNKSEKWDVLKNECAKFAKQFSKQVAQNKRKLLINLYDLKTELINEEIIKTSGHQSTNVIAEVSQKITELENEKVKSAMFRSKCQWERMGERNSKYFFALEKRKFNNKTAFSMFVDGKLCKNQKRILAEQRAFYETLYTSDPNVHFDMVNRTNIKLTEIQKMELDKPLEIDELFEAATSMEKNKVCGCDGLSLEFYIRFWTIIKQPLFDMYCESHERGHFLYSTKKGIISLLPKKDCDPRFLKHLRPLAILNYDYKILAKALASRLKVFLPDLIGEQQTGFMAGRNIQTNIQQTIDIITHINKSRKKAVIISIDFEKCFDRIEHRSIYETMAYFNIGSSFIGWTKVFFTDFLLCTYNAGRASQFFVKGRGVNQGCPISPFCYNLCGELMAHLIKNDVRIKGISLSDNTKNAVEFVISQFADDTALFLSFNEECLNAAIDALSRIERITGLKISYDKTTVYSIGLLKNTDAKIYTRKELSWSDGDISMLGVDICNDVKQNNECFDKTIVKMESITNSWINRNLTLMGKVLVVNTLLY